MLPAVIVSCPVYVNAPGTATTGVSVSTTKSYVLGNDPASVPCVQMLTGEEHVAGGTAVNVPLIVLHAAAASAGDASANATTARTVNRRNTTFPSP